MHCTHILKLTSVCDHSLSGFALTETPHSYVVTVAMQCCDIDKTFVVLTSYFEAMIISPLGFLYGT